MISLISILFGVIKTLFASKSTMIALLVALTIGMGGGWYVKSVFADAAELAQQKQAQKAYREAVERTIRQYDARIAITDEITSDYIDELITIGEQSSDIAKELQNVKSNSACSTPAGVVSLLNVARTGNPAGVSLPGASKLTYEKAGAPASITQRDEYQAHADCGIKYRKIAERYSSLIRWIESQTGKISRDQ